MTKEPRPHQQEAIENGVKYFSKNNRGKMIMPCGSGKTLTSLWLAKLLNANHLIVAFPNLTLEYQTVISWLKDIQDIHENYHIIVLGSDKKLQKEFDIQVTTDAEETKEFLLNNRNNKTVIFTTYHSSIVIREAVKDIDFIFYLCISDESHHTAGADKILFQILLENKNVNIRKRMFMTATPKVLIGRGDNGQVKSMDDESVYGKEFYHLSIRQAIEKGIICDYKVVSLYSSNEEILEYIRNKMFINDNSDILENQEEIRLVSIAISICKAIQEYDLKRVITYHNTIKTAIHFQELLRIIVKHFNIDASIFHLNSGQTIDTRNSITENYIKSDISIITNARLLTEGADIPSVDAICFVDNRHSATDIVQASGRAWRLSEGKEFAYILVPCIVSSENIESNELASLRKILTYLSGQDERLAAYFRQSQKKFTRKINIDDMIIHKNLSVSLDFETLVADVNLKVWSNIKNLYWLPLDEAVDWIRENLILYGINTLDKYKEYIEGKYPDAPEKPINLPASLTRVYKTSAKKIFDTVPFTYQEAKEWNFKNLAPLSNVKEYISMHKAGQLPPKMLSLSMYSRDEAFGNVEDFIPLAKTKWDYESFKEFVLKELYPTVHNQETWEKYAKGEFKELPTLPKGMKKSVRHYDGFSWTDIFPHKSKFASYKEQKKWVHENLVTFGIDTYAEYRKYLSGGYPEAPVLPDWVRRSPSKDSNFVSYNDFFGKV